LESYEKSKKKEKGVPKLRVEPKSNGIPDLKRNHYMLRAAHWLHDKLTFLLELHYATKRNV